ncbi:MAG: sigma 54-interacting transcriptional regulator [Deltaproteobacteria bacterium]|nr:sigma 54-interacting transcriptional regulator [Deltaproteobacteria bacterium]
MIEVRLSQGRTLVGRSDRCDLALPSHEVSRVHCAVDVSRSGRIEVTDRSRHGTRLNGQPITSSEVTSGDVVGVGPFQIHIVAGDPTDEPPSTSMTPVDVTEHVVGSGPEGLEVVRSILVVHDGPAAESSFPVPVVGASVGGTRSRIVVDDPNLLPEHFHLMVNEGRPMVEPSAGTVRVSGRQIRGICPIEQGEYFSAGHSTFRIVTARDAVQPEAPAFGRMVGRSLAMRRVFGLLGRVAPHAVTVLLLGESGTGKELAARGLHDQSPRAEGPFVAVNCAAITDTLFESELFGHEKGAFTGAIGRRDGAFHAADRGTLFLDEVGEIPQAAQAKLLRALETGEVKRVGATLPTFPNVRLVAATNRYLPVEVAEGRFREDLYFRLAVLTVELPPLRARTEDIQVLAEALCASFQPPGSLTRAAMARLAAHTWPGNVRELRNVLTRAYVLCGPRIDATAITFDRTMTPAARSREEQVALEEDADRARIHEALVRTAGNRTEAARVLGIPRTSLIYKMRRYDIEG